MENITLGELNSLLPPGASLFVSQQGGEINAILRLSDGRALRFPGFTIGLAIEALYWHLAG